jgi:phosphopantothenoylcysteine decarboxylase/phosphopantothenate--cysteine ligase
MGLALAGEAAHRGAEVTLIAANVALAPPPSVQVIEVATAAEMLAACEREFPVCDVLLMAAAVADFRPATPAAGKIKKALDPAHPAPEIELEPTADILGALAPGRRPEQVVVGFAAEHGDGALAYARGKRARKHLDAVVVNDISRPGIGFDAADNEVTIITADGERPVPRTSKAKVVAAVLDEVRRLAQERAGEGLHGAAGATAGSGARI